MKITLQIPDGNRCEDCMFLKVDYFDNHAECLLFSGRLQWDYEYGNIVEKTIKKCDKCRQITLPRVDGAADEQAKKEQGT